MSSIFRILRTVSLANVTALVLTSRGWTTFSSRMLVMAPFLTLIPAVFSPWACLFLSSVTVPITKHGMNRDSGDLPVSYCQISLQTQTYANHLAK